MGILTKLEIIRQVRNHRVVINPFIESHVGANSVDLRLGDTLLVYRHKLGKHIVVPLKDGCSGWDLEKMPLDVKEHNKTIELTIPDQGLVLEPGVLYLGYTMEHTESPYHVPCIEGRSSVARMGITIHSSAGFGDIGFRGQWTLELSVIHPIRVYAGIRICQIYYHTIEGSIGNNTYRGQYQDQVGVVAGKPL